MSSIDYKKLGSDLSGPFLQAFKGEITLDKAAEIAAYNMMMTFLMDAMAKAALKSVVAKFLFTGFFGSFITWTLTYLVKVLAIQGVNFAQNLAYQWHIERLRINYEANMLVYSNQIDLVEVLGAQDISNYKTGVKAQLKKFFNLSDYFKSK